VVLVNLFQKRDGIGSLFVTHPDEDRPQRDAS
jgi:hypothetical protein